MGVAACAGRLLVLHTVFTAVILNSVMRKLRCSSLKVLIEFSLTVKAATLIFISGRGSAISSAKE